LQHSGVAAGSVPAQRIIIAASTPAARKGAAEALSAVGAADRLDRREAAPYGRRITDQPGILGVIEVDAEAFRPERRAGAPSSAYLAQHIAQEVSPEEPGADRFQAGAQAYLARRDSTVEFMPATDRLDILV
jgi:hypothetical protein